MTTYYVRADGTAANKTAATSPDNAATSMNMTVFNSISTFSNNDIVFFSDRGGDFVVQFQPLSVGFFCTNIDGETPTILSSSFHTSIYVNTKSNLDISGIDVLLPATNTTNHAGIRLSNACDSIEIKNATIDVSLCTGTSYCFLTSHAATNITLENIIGIGAKGPAFYMYGIGTANLIMQNVSIFNSRSDAVQLKNVENINLSNMDISDTISRDVYIDTCSGTLLIDNINISNPSLISSSFVISNSTFLIGSKISNIEMQSGNGSPAFSIVNADNIEFNAINIGSGFKTGFEDSNGIGLTYNSCLVNNTTGIGFFVAGDGYGIEYNGCVAENNLSDGFACAENTANIIYNRNISRKNGNASDMTSAAGDGFTSHLANTGLQYIFNLAYENMFSGFALTLGSDGVLYHNTSINNNKGNYPLRGEFFLTGTSGNGWIIKNNIVMNTDGYPLYYISNYESTHINSDYNCYISNLNSPFVVNDAEKTFQEWIAIVGNETHSIFIHINNGAYDVYYGNAPTVKAATLTYCPIDSDGQLMARSGNPLIDTGIVISGINDGSQTDIWGYPIFGKAPNIGASQQYGYGTAEGTLTFKWNPGFNDADVSGNLNILSFNDTTTSAISYDADSNLIKIADGTNTASTALTVVADTEYTIQATWGLVSGSPKMQIAVDGIAGTQATFAGTFNPGDIYFGLGNEELQYVKELKF